MEISNQYTRKNCIRRSIEKRKETKGWTKVNLNKNDWKRSRDSKGDGCKGKWNDISSNIIGHYVRS